MLVLPARDEPTEYAERQPVGLLNPEMLPKHDEHAQAHTTAVASSKTKNRSESKSARSRSSMSTAHGSADMGCGGDGTESDEGAFDTLTIDRNTLSLREKELHDRVMAERREREAEEALEAELDKVIGIRT
jgi:hypothetical protein